MHYLKRFDAWLIDTVFEPVLHALEAATSWSNYAVARMLLILIPLARIIHVLVLSLHGKAPYYSEQIGTALMCIASFFLYLHALKLEALSKRAAVATERDRPTSVLIRVSTTIIIGSFLILEPFTVRSALAIAYWVYLYAMACRRMPPDYKENRSWVTNPA